MTYDLRPDFMANAVEEYSRVFGTKNRAEMVQTANLKERNAWFQMYVMGGVPFPGPPIDQRTPRGTYVSLNGGPLIFLPPDFFRKARAICQRK